MPKSEPISFWCARARRCFRGAFRSDAGGGEKRGLSAGIARECRGRRLPRDDRSLFNSMEEEIGFCARNLLEGESFCGTAEDIGVE